MRITRNRRNTLNSEIEWIDLEPCTFDEWDYEGSETAVDCGRRVRKGELVHWRNEERKMEEERKERGEKTDHAFQSYSS